jgi:hypothetical protein
VGVPLGVAEAPAVVVVVVVAGDMAVVAGVTPGIGEMPGAVAAGLTPVVAVAGEVTGAVTGAVAGEVTGAVAGLVAGGGEVWPNKVDARVTEQRLAISSVFIG